MNEKKRANLVMLILLIIVLAALVLVSGFFYFNIVLNPGTTGHITFSEEPENTLNVTQQPVIIFEQAEKPSSEQSKNPKAAILK